MKAKMISIFLCIVMVASIFAAFTQNLGPLSMNASGAGSLANSPWPMFRGNLNHTGLSSYDTGGNNGQLKWSFTTSDCVDSSPAIGSDGTIYVGSEDNKLYAINPDGTEKWNFMTGNEINEVSPAISFDGTIYIGSWDGKLYAINPDGTEKWSFTTGAKIECSSPAIGPDGTIYIGSYDKKLYAIYPDGTEKWNFTTGASIDSSPAISSEGIIYIGSGDDNLYAINPDGTEKWSFMTGQDVDSSPAIGSDGTIYVGSFDSKLYAINPNGTEKWNFTTGAMIWPSSPAIGSDGTIYIGSLDYKLYAINTDGTEKWSFMTGANVRSSPTIGSDGTIFIGSLDKKLYAVNPDGTEKWNFTAGMFGISSPSIGSDGTIYIGSWDNKLYAIGNPSLKVNVTSHFSILNSAAQSAITVHVINGTNPVPGASVNLATDNGGMFSPQSGTSDVNGNFTSIFNAPTVTTQIICRITAQTNKTGYNNGSGYVDVILIPIPWPMFNQNHKRTGLSLYDTSSNPGKLKWSFETSGSVRSPVIGSDRTIYVYSWDGKLYAINPDGTEKWNFTIGGYNLLSPIIDSDGTIYVGSDNNKLYAINPDGTEKWDFLTEEKISYSSAIGADGTIYVPVRDGKLFAINPDGTEKWNFTNGTDYFGSPAISYDGTIYIGSTDHILFAINPDGTEKWNSTSGDMIQAAPAIGLDGTIYVGSKDYNLYAIDQNGIEKWRFSTGGPICWSSSPAIAFDGTIYIGSGDHNLYAINPNGTEKWRFSTKGQIQSAPAIGSDGTIYFGSDDSNLYAINPDGTEKWNFTTGSIVHSSPAIGTDGTIYIGSFDNKLYAIGMADTLPILYINVSQDGEDAILYWDPPSTPGIDHYLIYRSTSQIDFDFNTVWVNTSKDYESGESGPIPLRTMWNDTNAALPSNETNYQEQYYYIIRAVDVLGGISGTSRTVGKWTKIFPQDVSTFSLPLEPQGTMNITIDHYLNDMNARYIKWMDPINRIWMKHGDGGVNDTQLEVGKGYEVSFDSPTNYTFTGMPGAMIRYDDDSGFSGFDPASEAKNLTAIVDPLTGNVTLNWTQPSSIGINDKYFVLRSIERDGFWKGDYLKIATLNFDVLSYNDIGNATTGTQYYYMIVSVNETGVEGASTYSIGVWTAYYLGQYDTISLPLKIAINKTVDWYCDNIPEIVGINYYIYNAQRWGWHSTRMPEGAFDPLMEMVYGYQISTTCATKFTFIGI